MPYWGVCLGVQLLAAALGAKVYPGPEPEVGLLPVSMTGAARTDPVFERGAARPRDAAVARRHLRPPRGSRVPCRLARLPEPGVPLRARVRRPVPPGSLGRDGARLGGGARVRRLARAHARSRARRLPSSLRSRRTRRRCARTAARSSSAGSTASSTSLGSRGHRPTGSARGCSYTPRGERSSSATFMRSRIETIPTTFPSSTTGRWRKPPWIMSVAA